MKSQTSIARRAFLARSAALLGTLAAGVGRADGLVPAPRLIIDTHTHFYDPTRPGGVPWPPKTEPRLYRKVLPADYQALPKPQQVSGTVVLEASPWVEDNQWILDLAEQNRFIVGFVGNLRPYEPEFRRNLKRFAANKIFRGIRVRDESIKRGLHDPDVRAGLKQLADMDLALDVNGPPALLPDVGRLARELPDLRIVVNHVANVRVDGQAPPNDWLRDMRALGRLKNVFCKVSGLVEGTARRDGTAPKSVEFYRPILNAIWDAFGPDHLIYGSNWPVSALYADCATVQQIVHDYFGPKGAEVVDKVFAGNAKTAYKWLTR